MTEKELSADLYAEHRRFRALCAKRRSQDAAEVRKHEAKIAALQRKCKHRDTSYASGGPYERGETKCDLCGMVVE